MPRRLSHLAPSAASALLALAWPAAASAIPAEAPRAVIDVVFTTTEPGAATGVTYRSELRHPSDPNADPIALRRLIVGLPAGSVVDTSVPDRCTATDEELRLRGDGICPPGSLVATGFAEIVVDGLGRQRFDASAFNDDGQQVETVKRGRQVNAVVRGFFTDEGLDALIPTCILGGQPPERCPADQARLLRTELVAPPYTVGGRSYFTTPPTCPPSGRWRTPVVLTYADGVTERVFPEQPCRRAGEPAPAAAPCKSRRRIVLRQLARHRPRSVTAVVAGRRVRLDRRRPTLDLSGLSKGRYTVRITAVTATGKRLRIVRRFRTCGG